MAIRNWIQPGVDLHPILRASSTFVPGHIDWGPAAAR
jgi:hypothetical protein